VSTASVLVAVIVTGPKVPTESGVPLKVLPLSVTHDGLPLIERSGTGKPDAANSISVKRINYCGSYSGTW